MLPHVSTLVLNLDDSLASSLAVMAARSRKPLAEWAAEQLTRLASPASTHSETAYTDEWRAAFGSLAPSVTGKWLLIDAAIAAGYGMSEADVLKAVTLVPAGILGIADRIGSLEAGKDADVIILDGPPLSVKTWVQRAYVNGELVYQK